MLTVHISTRPLKLIQAYTVYAYKNTEENHFVGFDSGNERHERQGYIDLLHAFDVAASNDSQTVLIIANTATYPRSSHPGYSHGFFASGSYTGLKYSCKVHLLVRVRDDRTERFWAMFMGLSAADLADGWLSGHTLHPVPRGL